MEEKKKVYILCAAIYYPNDKELVHGPIPFPEGWALCGHRHHQIIELYFSMTGKTSRSCHTQGFLTSGNEFVSRQRAAEIAFKAGQIKEIKHTLFSEDIY